MSARAGQPDFPARNRLALGLSLLVHVLALLLWARQPPPAPVAPSAPHVVSFLLRPAQPRPRPAPPSPPSEQGYPRPRVRTLPPAVDFFGGFPFPPIVVKPKVAQTSASSAAASSTPAQSAEAAPESAPAPALDTLRPAPSAADAIREQQQAEGGFGPALSRRQAGRIDRELRNGKSGIPDEPDTPIGRLRRGLEGAHADRSRSVAIDTYTSPDGTIIYRKRIGKGSICRRGGNVSPLGMKLMAMADEAADNIPCPSGVDWKKE